jgi:hypothetical protein
MRHEAGLDGLEAECGDAVPMHDGAVVVSWSRSVKLRESAESMMDAAWGDYVRGLREARRRSASGMVPVQDDLPREVAAARIAAVQARFPEQAIALGHRKLEAMTDGDLRTLLADLEELVAGE